MFEKVVVSPCAVIGCVQPNRKAELCATFGRPSIIVNSTICWCLSWAVSFFYPVDICFSLGQYSVSKYHCVLLTLQYKTHLPSLCILPSGS